MISLTNHKVKIKRPNPRESKKKKTFKFLPTNHKNPPKNALFALTIIII